MQDKYEINPNQSIELLKMLHILTIDGKLNQDSRRKLKQVYHLYHFIEPLLAELQQSKDSITLVDHGSGKSYLGFILYDLFFKNISIDYHVYSIENRVELVDKSKTLAAKLGFSNMTFVNLPISESFKSNLLPMTVDIVTALHACDTATDDVINYAIKKNASHIILVPCCQAEVSAELSKRNKEPLFKSIISEIWRRPIHSREFGSLITNILRCLLLESHGYKVKVTELVGWEHSLKNELIIANKIQESNPIASKRLGDLINTLGLEGLTNRFTI